MTFSEVLAHNRNLKRRRIRHRTTKEPPLTHTEEIRKLIGTQMEAMEKFLAKKKLSQFGKGEIVWDKNETSKIVSDKNNDNNYKVCDTNYKKTKSLRNSRSRSRSRHSSKKSRNKVKYRKHSDCRKTENKRNL